MGKIYKRELYMNILRKNLEDKMIKSKQISIKITHYFYIYEIYYIYKNFNY